MIVLWEVRLLITSSSFFSITLDRLGFLWIFGSRRYPYSSCCLTVCCRSFIESHPEPRSRKDLASVWRVTPLTLPLFEVVSSEALQKLSVLRLEHDCMKLLSCSKLDNFTSALAHLGPLSPLGGSVRSSGKASFAFHVTGVRWV